MGYQVPGMDNTLIFKNCVKTIRQRNRTCGHPDPEKNKEKRTPDPFATRAKQVREQISKLGKLITDTQAAYLNLAGHVPGTPQMTDSERNRLDWAVPRLASIASGLLQDLETARLQNDIKEQHQQHQQAVMKLLKDYLRSVTSVHNDMRATRVEKAQDAKKLSRLDVQAQSSEQVQAKTVIPAWTPSDSDNDDEALSPEELQVFQEENESLQLELSGITQELRLLEGTVASIAKLQDEFTQKILEQEKDIDRVAGAVIGTTENLKDANEQLRQAIQRNAGFRAYILFFLIVLSFSLLFIDWYRP